MSTAIRQYVNSALSSGRHVESAIESGEAIVVGGVAGLVSGQRADGLDYAVGASGSMKVPLDGAVGGLGMLAATFAPMGSGTREIVKRAAGNLLAIASFRKSEGWSKPAVGGATAAGEFGDDQDPIVKAAALL